MFATTSKLLREAGCKFSLFPLTLALACNTAYCATAAIDVIDAMSGQGYVDQMCQEMAFELTEKRISDCMQSLPTLTDFLIHSIIHIGHSSPTIS